MGRKKKVLTPEVPPISTEPQVIPIATKAYIYDKMDKLPLPQIATNTGLTLSQVEKLIMSRELDVRPTEKNNKPQALRRYDIQDGSVSLTPAQAKLNDMATREIQSSNIDNLKKVMGPDLEMITLNPQ